MRLLSSTLASRSYLRLLVCFLVLLMVNTGCSTQKPKQMARRNVGLLYNPASDYSMAIDHLVQSDSLLVWVRFGSRKLIQGRLPSDLTLHYSLSQNYESTDRVYIDSVRNLPARVQWQSGQAVVRLGVLRRLLGPGQLLTLTLIDRVGDQQNSLDLPLTAQALEKQYVLLAHNSALPLFQHFLNPTDSFRIAASDGSTTIEAIRYENTFLAALPPMSMTNRQVSPDLKELGRVQLPLNQVHQLKDPGLYALQPAKGSGGVLLVEENDFPELTTAAELIEPLLYITTSREREALYKAPEPKKAVDKFWLDIGGNQQFARTLIRAYYLRVVDTNKLFTSHKPGWMSDRGMIYIVLGKPESVFRHADREVWAYPATNTRPSIQFTFNKRNHTLTQNHYELLRDPVFEQVWYSAAEKWRKGIIDP